MTIDEVVREVENNKIQQIQCLYVDNGGIVRGKVSSAKTLKQHMVGGIGLTPAMQAMNMMDELNLDSGLGPVGEIRLIPDPESFRVLPYLSRTASMMCDMVALTGNPWTVCSRSFLRRQVDHAKTLGFRIIAAYEDEFSLAHATPEGSYVPLDPTLCFSSSGMVAAHAVIADIMDALESQGIDPEQYYPELGHGQHELSVSPREVLQAADNQVRYRETVRAVAAQHGLKASFAPKPWPDQAGNGAHIHFSVWDIDADRNVFWDPDDPYHLSMLGYQFAAGVLAHLPALVALTCASVNSYRRLNPRSWSSAYTAFGPDNREAAVRIASVFWGNEARSINLELKASDSSANPYLALGGLIAAGLDGVARQLPPVPPLLVDPATLSDAEREKRHIARLPQSLGEALDALEKDEVLKEALGPDLLTAYVSVKRSEIAHFRLHDAEYEFRQHFEKF
ncbi:MAG: glutamine synthetase family protein [Firmicutes bacterium]|nr:glutamine synthetase family protein [Bacillota bacterium]